MARTDTLPHFLTDVAGAIREKKGTEETIQASDFDTEIASIESSGDVSDYFNTNIGTPSDFHKNNIKKIPALTIVDGVNILSDYFFNWSALEEIENISGGVDVASYEGFLNNCKKLENIKFNNLNTSKVITMYSMFNRCEKLTSLDLSSFTSESLTTTSYMFIGCKALMYIDMRNMTFDNVTAYTGMFYTTSSDGVPANCEIIVKSQTEKEWITSKFSRLTNVKTVAELE